MVETDRELLEAAAKAAGIEVVSDGKDFWIAQDGIAMRHWNPLAEDGAALRLAVRLNLHVLPTSPHSTAVVLHWAGERIFESHHTQSSDAATRRCIVRAAAEIGKAMP